MSEKRKYPSTELSTAQRELIARLVGPLEARGISRSVFRDILADAEITVPKTGVQRVVENRVWLNFSRNAGISPNGRGRRISR